MIKVYKHFYRRDGVLESIMPHAYSLIYPENGMLVEPSLNGSLLFGYVDKPSSIHVRHELWVCETTGPVSYHTRLGMSSLVYDPFTVERFWRGEIESWSKTVYIVFPDVRLVRRVG